MLSSRKRKLLLISLPVFLTVVFFLSGQIAWAETWATSVLTGLLSLIISALGLVLVLVINVLIRIAEFSSFIHSAAVVNGWVIVRDICNMFFVVILLIIAFGTILHLENYNYKKWLPKLILMAVLINFSKTICGLLIDVAQVVMLTFVNAFKEVAGGNLIEMLGIKEILTFEKTQNNPGDWTIIGAYVLGLIYLIISIIVIVAMLAMLVMRIVMIWIYVVLSPLAYLLSAFPGGQSYASQWWSEFTKNLIVGPVLAFFIWLSFATLQSQTLITTNKNDLSGQTIAKQGEKEKGVAFTEASTPNQLMKFVIAIGMLLGGMKIASSIGGEAAGVAGKVFSKGKTIAAGAALGAAAWAGRGALSTAKNWGGDLVDKASLKLGTDLNIVSGYKRYRQAVEARRASRKQEIRGVVLQQAEKGSNVFKRKVALLSTGDVAYDNFKAHNFFKGGGVYRYADKIRNLGINEAKEERKKHSTFKENYEKFDSLKKEKDEIIPMQIADVDAEINAKNKAILAARNAGDYDGTSKEKLDKADLDALNVKKQSIENRNIEVTKEMNDLKKYISSGASVDSHQKAMSLDKEILEKETKAEEYNKMIRDRSLISATGARIASQSAIESEQGKVIAYINNSDELVRMVVEGIKAGEPGLVSVAAKKLARTGNYNELNKALGLGTDLQGMHDLAKYFEKEAGMDTQTARGLVAEIGELAKGVGHIEAFGTMNMDAGGNWHEASSIEHEASVLAEKTKIQSQKFVRDINRLGIGFYESGKPHTAENWTLSKSTIKLYASKDAAYAEDMRKTGNPSQIYFIGSNKKNLELLEQNGAPLVAKAIRELMQGAGGVQDYEKAIRSIDNIY